MKNLITVLFLFSALTITKAQDYHHYFISWADQTYDYYGVMAINTRIPTQVLQLIYYSNETGEYRLIEEKFRLSFNGSRFFLASTRLSDRTACYEGYADHYNADNFYLIENGLDIQMWNRDDAGVEAEVDETFIPLNEIDGYKPIFWPEAYGICNSSYWHNLIQTILQ